MSTEIYTERKIGLSFWNILSLYQNFSLLNATKLLPFHCSLKGFKIINNIAADWIIILMGYSSKSLWRFTMKGFYNWNPSVIYKDNLNAYVFLKNWLQNIEVLLWLERALLWILCDKMPLTLICTSMWDVLILFCFCL